MDLKRREFLTIGTAGSLLAAGSAEGQADGRRFALHKPVTQRPSICPYCSVGCGVIVGTDSEGHVVNVEGDPEHPINRGALDPKSIAIPQLCESPLRLRTVRYRAAGSDRWEDKPWDWAIAEIARRVKGTRDATFVEKNAKGVTVNRTEGIAWLGGAANTSEDCYLAAKLMRALGVVWLEHQARV